MRFGLGSLRWRIDGVRGELSACSPASERTCYAGLSAECALQSRLCEELASWRRVAGRFLAVLDRSVRRYDEVVEHLNAADAARARTLELLSTAATLLKQHGWRDVPAIGSEQATAE